MFYVEFLAKNRAGKVIDKPKIIPATIEAIERGRDYYGNDVVLLLSIWEYENENIENLNTKIIAPLYFDLDSKDDLETARREAIELIKTFENPFNIPNNQIYIYFSGYKGFHIEIPAVCFGAEPHHNQHLIYKSMVQKIIERLKLKTVGAVYDRRRKWRLPNSINEKSGLHKIPLTFAELQNLTIEQIKELATKQRNIETAPATLSEDAGKFYLKYKENVEEGQKTKTSFENLNVNINSIASFPCIQTILNGVTEGERDDACFELANHFKENGKGIEETLREVQKWNPRNSPPLNQYDIEKCVNSAYKGNYKIGCSRPLLQKYCNESCILKKQRTRGENPNGKSVKDKYFQDGKFVPKLLADEIMDDYRFITTRDNNEIFYYNDGIYHPNAESSIKEETKKRLKEETTEHRANEILFQINVSTYVERDRINNHPMLVHLQNGIFDLDKMKIVPFSEDIISTIKLPIKYDASADCPKIKKFLSEVLTEGDIPNIQELFGYTLLKDYQFQTAVMLVGEGNNGKSTLLSLFKHFLGMENISGVSLQDLETRFAKAELYGKLANIHADLSDKALYSTGMFKMLTGGDIISAEQKFKGRFNFINHAKLLFSANKLPESRDDTSAFFRRWIIIKFLNTFDRDKTDPKILEKITTNEELSGLFNWAVEGLKRLLTQGGFSYRETTEEIRDKYERMSNPLSAFIKDKIEIDPNSYVSKDEFYAEFVKYCQENKLLTKAKNVVGRDLPSHIPTVCTERPRIRGDRIQVWKGIKLTNKDGEHVKDVNDISYFNSISNPVENNMNNNIEENPDIPDRPDQGGAVSLDAKETIDKIASEEGTDKSVATGDALEHQKTKNEEGDKV
ncbi:MAG: phage/plasmid primase, P4 family [Thermoplasmata archaeon]